MKARSSVNRERVDVVYHGSGLERAIRFVRTVSLSQKNPSPLSKHEAWILIDTLSKVFREFSCRFVYEGLARVSEPTI